MSTRQASHRTSNERNENNRCHRKRVVAADLDTAGGCPSSSSHDPLWALSNNLEYGSQRKQPPDLIEHHKSFHPITIFGMNRFHPKRAVDLPSWAVDMGIDGYKLSVPSVCRDGDSWAWLSMNNYNMYNASGSIEIDWERFNFNPSDGSLSVSATHVDEIRTVGAALSSETMSDQDMIARITEWYSTANDFYHAQDWLDPALRRGLWQWPASFWRGLVGNLARVIYDFEPTRQATESDLLQVYEFVRTGERSLVCQETFLTMVERTMFMTKNGLLGFGPRNVEVSDQVYIFRGGKMPMVLRRYDASGASSNRFVYVGPSYVDGIMDGELAAEVEKNSDVVTLI